MKQFIFSRFAWLAAALAVALSAPVGSLDAKPPRGKKAPASKVSGKGHKGPSAKKSPGARGGGKSRSGGLIASRAGHGKKPSADRSAPRKPIAVASRSVRPADRDRRIARHPAPRPVARHMPDRVHRPIPYGPLFWPLYGLSTDVETAAPIYEYSGYPLATRVAVQSELARLGYYYGSIDGVIGPMSRAAIARYQSEYGLAVTASINGALLESLGLL